MHYTRAWLLCSLLAGGIFLSQNLPARADSSTGQAGAAPAVISGLVVKLPGGEPVKKALIELIAENQSDGANYTALTGTDGSFRIENILPGRYRLFVEHTGYQEVDRHHRRTEGRVLALTAGQELKDLVIHLQAAAVIEGRITDEDGDPMPEAQVAVLRQTFTSGRRRWEQVGAERTNDLGEYRIANLAAGNYFVSVSPPPDFRSLIETAGNAASPAPSNTAPQQPAPMSYQVTYYPNTKDRGQAAPIQLRAGDDFPANFSLTPGPSLTISGSVVNLPQGCTAAITLQSKDFNLLLNSAEMHKDGSFEIRDVSPGAYTILATVDNAPVAMTARQPVLLGSANVEGLRLAPQPGGTVRGHLRIEGGNFSSQFRADPAQLFLQLRSDDDEDALGAFVMSEGFSPVAHVNADGSFEWKNVPAGNYFVEISGAGLLPDWFLKYAAAGGRDALDAGFSVNGGTTTLDLIASGNGAVAEGIATARHDEDQHDEPAADVTVVAVPQARFRGQSNRYRKAVTDQRGHFVLRGLSSGDYTLFAWESVDGDAYYSADFLKSYEGQGQVLHVKEGEHKSVHLNVILASEEGP
jgi:Carboxypeptidase regulatory-like domain